MMSLKLPNGFIPPTDLNIDVETLLATLVKMGCDSLDNKGLKKLFLDVKGYAPDIGREFFPVRSEDFDESFFASAIDLRNLSQKLEKLALRFKRISRAYPGGSKKVKSDNSDSFQSPQDAAAALLKETAAVVGSSPPGYVAVDIIPNLFLYLAEKGLSGKSSSWNFEATGTLLILEKPADNGSETNSFGTLQYNLSATCTLERGQNPYHLHYSLVSNTIVYYSTDDVSDFYSQLFPDV